MNKIANNLEKALYELSELFGNRLSTNETVRDHHSHDESWHEKRHPDAVCFVNSMDDVSRTMEICSRYKIPVVPFGAGTGLEGGTVAYQGGICIDVAANWLRSTEVENSSAAKAWCGTRSKWILWRRSTIDR